jgi:SMC interacting uncharacterized protein involved in chromosome segregation
MSFATSKKARLNEEIARLEKELEELSPNLSESQTSYKRARLQQLKQQLEAVDKNKFDSASKDLQQKMQQQDIAAAMSQAQARG